MKRQFFKVGEAIIFFLIAKPDNNTCQHPLNVLGLIRDEDDLFNVNLHLFLNGPFTLIEFSPGLTLRQMTQ